MGFSRIVLLALALVLGCTSEGTSPTGLDGGEEEKDGGKTFEPIPCDAVAPTSCPSPPLTYADVEPIFEQRCVVCHNGAADGPWSLRGYSHVADWQDIIPPNLLN